MSASDAKITDLKELLRHRSTEGATWQALFNGDKLIDTMVPRLHNAPNAVNAADSHPSGNIMCLNDWSVIETFRECGLSELQPRFLLAEPSGKAVLNPARLRVGIIIDGPPAAGLNMLVDALVKGHYVLATERLDVSGKHGLTVVGYLNGYRGLMNGKRLRLAPSSGALKQGPDFSGESTLITDNSADEAGSRLSTSQADADAAGHLPTAAEIAAAFAREELDIVYVVGSARDFAPVCAASRELAVTQRTRETTLIGASSATNELPCFLDVSLGFRSAVDHVLTAIRDSHSLALSNRNLVVIHVWGGPSQLVAAHAAYASGLVDYVAVEPAVPQDSEVLIQFLANRVAKNGHALLVVADDGPSQLLTLLRQRFPQSTAEQVPCFDAKQAPASFDLEYAKCVGRLMVDAALAGYSQCLVHLFQARFVLVPAAAAVARQLPNFEADIVAKSVFDRQRRWLRPAVNSTHDSAENWMG